MIPADPYHQISPSLEWHGDGASYPFLNPSNFVKYPTVYNLSRPHLPYVARYPQDPSIRLDFSCQHHHPFRLNLKEYMCYKTWMEKQLNLYAAWDHFARDINFHVSLIHIGNLSQPSPLDMERNLERARLGPAARLGPQPPGVRLEPRIVHGGIIGEIQAKGRKFP